MFQHFFHFNIYSVLVVQKQSLTGSLNHCIVFSVIVPLEWYVLIFPLFQSSIDFKWTLIRVKSYENFNVDYYCCDALNHIKLMVINCDERNSRGLWHLSIGDIDVLFACLGLSLLVLVYHEVYDALPISAVSVPIIKYSLFDIIIVPLSNFLA